MLLIQMGHLNRAIGKWVNQYGDLLPLLEKMELFISEMMTIIFKLLTQMEH